MPTDRMRIDPKPGLTHSRAAAIVLVALFAIVWFGTLDARRLIKPDEGRYAEIAREMSVSGDWLTPRLNDLKYFEKPPLQYWATALAYDVFGVNEWTARLWTALTGFFGIAFAGFTAARIYDRRTGLYAAAVLASSALYALLGHVNTLDMALSVFMGSTLYCTLLARAAVTPGARRGWMLAAWAAIALAVLSKGPVGLVLPGAVLVVYLLASRDWTLLWTIEPVLGPLVFLAITAPWFVAVSRANPEFPHFFFIHEHVQRFLTSEHRRTGAWWYFLPILIGGILPWLTVACDAVGSFRNVFGRSQTFAPSSASMSAGESRFESLVDSRFKPELLLAIWSILIFVFFSVSGSKLPSYILPIFPALALLIAHKLACLSMRGLRGHLIATIALAVVGVAAVLAANHSPRFVRLAAESGGAYGVYRTWILVSLAIWLAGLVAAVALASRQKRDAAVLATAFASLIAWSGILLGHDALRATTSSYDLARQLAPTRARDPAVPFYSVGMYDHTLDFYLGRTAALVALRDELDLGIQQEPWKWLPTIADFERRWNADPEAFAIMGADVFATLRKNGLPMRVVFDDGRRVVIAKE